MTVDAGKAVGFAEIIVTLSLLASKVHNRVAFKFVESLEQASESAFTIGRY